MSVPRCLPVSTFLIFTLGRATSRRFMFNLNLREDITPKGGKVEVGLLIGSAWQDGSTNQKRQWYARALCCCRYKACEGSGVKLASRVKYTEG